MPESRLKPSRRWFMWGTASAGAAVAAAVVLPKVQPQPEASVSEPQPAPERGGGYRLSEHVQRYYNTTRV
jgi:hypothetical protein